MVRPKLNADKSAIAPSNRFVQVLEIAARKKLEAHELTRPSLAEEFFRENPMPWLLDSDPVDDPAKRQAS
jgi:hypothetical protein